MLEYLVSSTLRLPVVFRDASANPVAGAIYNGVIASVIKANGDQVDVTVISASWITITASAYSGQGYYNFVLDAAYVNVTGVYQYCVTYTGTVPYFGVIKVTDGDTGAVYNRLGVPNYGTIKDDIANVGVTAGSGGFTAGDRAILSATWHTASLLPADPASQSGVLAAVTQGFWTGDRQNLNTIKGKTDNLPSDPASQATTNTNISNVTTNVNNNTNNGFTTIQGAGWSSNTATLKIIGDRVYSTYLSGATQAFLSYTFGQITGAAFVYGTDDLHSLSIAIQGITPGSGGGGFSSADRTALYSAYSSTLPLPADPASFAAVSGVISESRKQVRGEWPYGATSGTSTASLSIYGLSTASQNIYTKTNYIQSTNYVPTYADLVAVVNSGVAVMAGPTFVLNSSTLGGIYAAGTASSFTAQDRVWISSTYASQSIVKGAVDTTNNNVIAVKAKTDLLPNDVVSTAHIDPILNQILSASAVSGGFSTGDRDNIIYISQTLGKPTAATVATDIFNVQTTLNNQGAKVDNIYSKTSNLPVDPVSTTYVTLVSQTLGAAIANGNAGLSSTISSSNHSVLVAVTNSFNALSGGLTASDNAILARLGTPAGASVSADIAAVNITAGNAYSAASAADTHAQQATSQATAASAGTANIIAVIGTPMSGTVSADISATYHAAASVSSSFSGTVGVDLSPILKVLGKPVKTIADDIKHTAFIAASGSSKK